MGIGKPMSNWKMQETTGTTVADFMGTNNTGTATSGNARRFGPTDYVTISSKVTPIGAKTIKFKLRTPSTGSRLVMANSSTTSGTYDGIQIGFSGNVIYFYSYYQTPTPAGARFQASAPYPVGDNKWHEIMMTWDGTTNPNAVKIFVDDMIAPAATATSSSTEVNSPFFNFSIGRDPNAAASGTPFDIDDIQVTDGYLGAGTVKGWWKCDDTQTTAFADSSASALAVYGITGTTILTNDSMPIIHSDGSGGYCRYFNGRNDRITFTSQVLPLGAKSIRFKMKTTVNDASARCILDQANNSSTNRGIVIAMSNGKLYFDLMSGGSMSFGINSGSKLVNDGVWHDVLCTWDGTTNTNGVEIYIDDMTNPVAQGTATVTESTAATYNLTIGSSYSQAANTSFQGDLQNIQIYVGAGTERTNPSQMQVGDFIAASYVAASGAFGAFSGLGASPSSFIPPASSVTSNGGCYLIYVGDDFLGRKILIADRNVQNSISWDTLNTAGVASGSGLPIQLTATPIMTSNTAPSGIASASDTYSGLNPWKAFDGNLDYGPVSGVYHAWGTKNTTGWLSYQFPSAKVINAYDIYSYGGTNNGNPKNWTFEGSNDGSTWTVLDTVINASFTANKAIRRSFNNGNAYIYYRVNVSTNDGSTAGSVNLVICELQMYEPSKNYNFTTRLLTGGTSGSDTDDEWDNFIVKSSLNGTITPGDNNVWNWSGGGIFSLASTTAGSAYRAMRGGSAVSSWSNSATSTVNATTGFRPVILVESLSSKKYLVQDGTDVKAFTAGTWSTVGVAPATEAMFTANGMADLTAMMQANLSQLITSTPQLLVYDTQTVTGHAMGLTAVPNAKLVMPSGDIDIVNAAKLNSVTIATNLSGNGIIRVVVSLDQGVTWQVWNGSAWVVIDITNLANVKTNGMTPATVNGLVTSNWMALLNQQATPQGTIRFAYYLELSASTDQAATDSIAFNMDMNGIWNRAIPGTDYKYSYTDNSTLKVLLYTNGDYKVND